MIDTRLINWTGSKPIDYELIARVPPLEGATDPLAGRTVLNLGPCWPEDELFLAARADRWVAVDNWGDLIDWLREVQAGRRPLEGGPPGIDACLRAEAPARLARVEFVYGDFRALPLPDRAFDLALDLSSGEHVPNGRDRMRRECARVLRPGGYYIVTYPNLDRMGGAKPDAGEHDAAGVYTDALNYGVEGFGYEHRYHPDELEQEVRAAGFEVLHHDTSAGRSGLIARRGVE